ncbi:MAG TPA: nitroreductase family protein [Anaerolineales bacterium]|nr:nitroreductase family protein [Anaerolineales bacterium]
MNRAAEGFYSVLNGRRSVREFSPDPVALEVVERVLQAACRAPSAHNRQPWRFVVLSREADRAALAQAMASRLKRERQADGHAPEAIEADVARARRRLSEAPVAIVVCMTPEDMDRYPDERRQRAEWTMMTQSVAMAGQNLLLAAHAEGLGACWMCAPLFAPDEVRRELGLAESWEPQGMVLMGRPAAVPAARAKRPASEVTQWR